MKRTTYKIVLKQTGSLFLTLGIVVIVPALVAAIYREWYSAMGFLLSGLMISCTGLALYRGFYQAEELRYYHALVVAAFGWLAITLAGGLPFFLIAWITPVDVMNRLIPSGSSYDTSSLLYFRNFLHCFFESMSAYTTTGLSMAVHEPSVGKGVLFYRSLAQWTGGAGFIVLVLAILKQSSGRGAMLLYGSETTGERLTPKVIETARGIWKVYVLVTAFSAVYLFAGTWLILPGYPLTENLFDSINHAMCGQSTGGFSTLDDSIATYHSPAMDMLYLLPMILGSFSLPFFYKLIYKRKFNELWKDIQTRALLITFVAGGIIQSLLLFRANVVPEPFREGTFQFVSAMSTTGWQTSNIGNWDWLSVVFIVGTAMYVGGAAGGTVGGIKMIRALLIKKVLRWQVNKVFLSRYTVKSMKFNGKVMLPEEMNEEFTKASALAIIFFLLVIGSSVAGALYTEGSFTYADALFESGSAQGTVGLSSGITDPGMPWGLELIYIFQMWSGRLEIIPVFALIRGLIWGTNPGKI